MVVSLPYSIHFECVVRIGGNKIVYKNILLSNKIFLILTIFACSLAEIIFLEKTHGFLQGEYGQLYGITTFIDRLKFFSLYLFFNLVLYGCGFAVWQIVFKKFNINKNVIAFHFMMVAGIMTAIYLVVSLQLQKYFADVVNVTLMKNVAGGSLKTALIYVLDEAALLIIGIIIVFGIYYTISKYSHLILMKFDNLARKNKPFFDKPLKLSHYLIVLLITAFAIINVNSNEQLSAI